MIPSERDLLYPPGATPDLARDEAPPADAAARIAAVPLPVTDPLFGGEGPLTRLWRGCVVPHGRRHESRQPTH